jgi:RNA polymerase sigma-70 factor (ECF subfamily)
MQRMKPENIQDQFVQELISCQPLLHAYILSLLPNWNDASDVLQDTNLVLWHRSEEFIEGTNFLAWAYKIARHKVLARCREQRRSRLIFDHELFALVADQAEQRTLQGGSTVRLLKECVKDLSPFQRDLLRRRYAKNGSVQMMARTLGRSAAVISVTLWRIRNRLLKCIRRKLDEEIRA